MKVLIIKQRSEKKYVFAHLMNSDLIGRVRCLIKDREYDRTIDLILSAAETTEEVSEGAVIDLSANIILTRGHVHYDLM